MAKRLADSYFIGDKISMTDIMCLLIYTII